MSFISQQYYSPVSLLSIILPHHSASLSTQQRQQRQKQPPPPPPPPSPHHHHAISNPLFFLITTTILLLCLPSPVASQTFINNGCISLANSTTCRGFKDYYVGISTLARYSLSNNLSSIDDFDEALNNYTISTRPYIADLGCYSAADLDDLNAANPPKRFPYARYSKSRLCAALVQDADYSLPCNNKNNVAPSPLPLCESTCEQWLSSVSAIITNHTDVCPNTGQSSVLANMNYLNSSCTDWSGFNGTTGYCVNGDKNEYNCGFSNSTNDACDYCSKHQTEACCQQVTSCSNGGLSVGAIIGIVIAVIVVLVAIGLGLFFFCFKRNKHIRKENSFSFKTYISPSTQHQQQLNTIGNDDMGGGGGQYSGNKVLLQNDINNNNNGVMGGTMATQSSRQTGHRSQLSDPFGDHYEVVSLPPNNNNNHSTITTNSESLLQDSAHVINGDNNNDADGNGQAYEEEFYQVVHPYPPQVADELGLQVGDIVCLAMGFDDGWALGFNVTTGLKGVFPLVCVSLIPPSVLEQLLISSDNQQQQHHHHQQQQLFEQQQQNDIMADTLSTFSSKVLVEDDDSALDQHSLHQRRLSRSSQLALSIRRIREDMRRSLSLSSTSSSVAHLRHHPSPLSASNSISSPRSMRPSSPSPSFLSHQSIPRRTASMVRHTTTTTTTTNNNNSNHHSSTLNYAECDSPTSPTHQTPLFNETNHHLHQPSSTFHNNDSFEMYHHSPPPTTTTSHRISKQES